MAKKQSTPTKRRRPRATKKVPGWHTPPTTEFAVYVNLNVGERGVDSPDGNFSGVIVTDGVYVFANEKVATDWMLSVIGAAGWAPTLEGLDDFQMALGPSDWFHLEPLFRPIRTD